MTIEEIDFGAPPEDLFAGVADRSGSFFLDSARPDGGLGAFSFLGCDPFLEFRAEGSRITITGGGRSETRTGNPLDELGRLLARYRTPGSEGGPLPFCGGAVGHLSYELGASLSAGPRSASPPLPERAASRSGIRGSAAFGFHDGFLAFDHAAQRGFAVANPVAGRSAGEILAGLKAFAAAPAAASAPSPPASPVPLQSSFSKDAYLAAIGRIKDYIRSGDVYQVNLSQRFDAPLSRAPYSLYRRLRSLSPAPFAGFLNHGDIQIASSSPELFLRIRGGRVETRPIKGTRRRSADPAEDARLAAELTASEKDRAELLMIVDLERNDLGRVCEYGSIRVEDNFRLESHPTVHHLVATVSGRLRPGQGAADAVRALFPGGSITGAPKIRAMQIIEELEPCPRGVYTGATGYVGFDGNCDLAIAIRTMTCAGGRVYFHGGGGIVWDSNPESEYQETLDKAWAMREAVSAPEKKASRDEPLRLS